MAVGSEAYSRTVEVLNVEVGSGGGSQKLSGIAIRYEQGEGPP